MATLNNRITVESATTVADAYGGQTVTWSTAYNLWADIRAVKGREEERLGRLVSVETYLFTVRYGPTLSTDQRIVWNGKTLNIRSVQDRDTKRKYLTIEGEVGVGT